MSQLNIFLSASAIVALLSLNCSISQAMHQKEKTTVKTDLPLYNANPAPSKNTRNLLLTSNVMIAKNANIDTEIVNGDLINSNYNNLFNSALMFNDKLQSLISK